MDAADERLIEELKEALDLACPGFLARLEALNGEFLPVPEAPKYTRGKDGNIRALRVSLCYLIGDKHVRVNMTMTCVPQVAPYKIVHWAYHCGPSQATDEVYFRVCCNKHQGFHFHLRGRGGACGLEHIAAKEAEPAITEDPIAFIGLVETFLAGYMRTLPLKVKS